MREGVGGKREHKVAANNKRRFSQLQVKKKRFLQVLFFKQISIFNALDILFADFSYYLH